MDVAPITRCPRCLTGNSTAHAYCTSCGMALPFGPSPPVEAHLRAESSAEELGTARKCASCGLITTAHGPHCPACGVAAWSRDSDPHLAREGLRLFDQVDGWRLLRPLLGSGASAVFEVAHVEGGDRAVLKFPGAGGHTARWPENSRRFERAVSLFAPLEHEGVVNIFARGHLPSGVPYLVEELLERDGPSRLRFGRGLPLSEAARIVEGIAVALAYIHSAGLIHRECTPGKMVATARGRGRVVLLESSFAIARGRDVELSTENPITDCGSIVGAPGYLAPEVIMGQPPDTASDIYSLGVSLYEFLTGHQPFEAKGTLNLLDLHLNVPPTPPEQIRQSVPLPLSCLTMRMLSKEPERRPASALEVAMELAAFRSDIEIDSQDSPRAWYAPHGGPRAALRARLRRAGFERIIDRDISDGSNCTSRKEANDSGLSRYLAHRNGQDVEVFVVPAGKLTPLAWHQADALAFLARFGSSLFSPVGSGVLLPGGGTAYARPLMGLPAQLPGGALPEGPSLAIAAVAVHALGQLAEHGRAYDNLTRDVLRADLDETGELRVTFDLPFDLSRPGAPNWTWSDWPLRCITQPREQGTTETPEALRARTIGVLLYDSLTGWLPSQGPADGLPHGEERPRQAPETIRTYRPDLSHDVAFLVDSLLEPGSPEQRRPLLALEHDLLSLLRADPRWSEWDDGTRRCLARATLADARKQEPRRRALLVPAAPTSRGDGTAAGDLYIPGETPLAPCPVSLPDTQEPPFSEPLYPEPIPIEQFDAANKQAPAVASDGIDTRNGEAPEIPERPAVPPPLAAPRADSFSSLSSGETVLDWQVASPLSCGAEAELFRVRDETGRTGVLKLWHGGQVDARSPAWRRFRRTLMAWPGRPFFPRLLDFGIDEERDGRPFAVFESLDAPTWSALSLSSERPEGASQMVLASRLMAAIRQAHSVFGPIGDLSATNVIVEGEDDPRPLLLDIVGPGHERSAIAGYGTPGFMGPEIALGGTPTVASDLFSAGVLLAEMALGRRLFPRIARDTSLPVGGYETWLERANDELRASLPPGGFDVTRRLLAPAPELRYTSAADAADAIDVVAGRARVREAAQQRRGSSSLQGLERRLPRPVAQALRLWRLARDPRYRIYYGFGLGEVAARLLAGIALSDYLSEASTDDDVEECLMGLVRPPTFGSWVSIGRTTAASLRRRGNPFVPELVSFFLDADVDAGLETLAGLVPERNKVIHGQLVIPPGHVPEIDEEVERHVRNLLERLDFLGAYSLVTVSDQDTLRDGRAALLLRELRGTMADPEQRQLLVDHALPSGTVALLSPELSERLLLEPFAVERPCPTCGRTHLGLLSRARSGGDIEAVHYATGHIVRGQPRLGPGLDLPFPEFLAQRGELHLRGPLGVRHADALRYLDGERALRCGTLLDRRYLVDEEIGRGAMGIVYRGRRPELGRECAIKVVRPELVAADPGLLRRLVREARTLERLRRHPNIVEVFDAGMAEDDSTSYLVMELITGGSLDDRLARPPSPGIDEVLRYGTQLADALSFAHEQRVYHRDIKPSNVLCAADGSVKLADFGVARDVRLRHTTSMVFAGAPAYRAPEQSSGGQIGPWTDHFALGLLLFDLLRGRRADKESTLRARQAGRWLRALEAGDRPLGLVSADGDERLLPLVREIVRLTSLVPQERAAAPALPPTRRSN